MGFVTHRCYCDGSQVTTLLCFTEMDITLCYCLMLNCTMQQSTGITPRCPGLLVCLQMGEANDLLCLFISWILGVSPFALSIFIFFFQFWTVDCTVHHIWDLSLSVFLSCLLWGNSCFLTKKDITELSRLVNTVGICIKVSLRYFNELFF